MPRSASLGALSKTRQTGGDPRKLKTGKIFCVFMCLGALPFFKIPIFGDGCETTPLRLAKTACKPRIFHRESGALVLTVPAFEGIETSCVRRCVGIGSCVRVLTVPAFEGIETVRRAGAALTGLVLTVPAFEGIETGVAALSSDGALGANCPCF